MSGDPATPHARLDARDLICPMPVLKARRALRDLPPGAVLEVLTTDRAAPADFRAFCEATGHRLRSLVEDAEGVATVTIEKAG